MPGPLISVVMPVYNCGPYLLEAIDSVLNQTEPDFELIAIDDGSTDSSASMLDERAGRDPRIVVVHQSNGGATRALNAGVSRARGEFVARMDGDDICHRERFARQARYLHENPRCVAVGSAIVLIDAEGNPLCESPWPENHREIDAALLAGRNEGGLAHPTAMIRKSSLDAVGGYREKYRVAQDRDLWLRLAEHGMLANLPEPLLKYRMHLASTGSTKAAEQLAAYGQAIAEACGRRGIPVPQNPPAIDETAFLAYSDPAARLAMLAIRGRNYRIARQYAWDFTRRHPLNPRAWMLVAFALGAPIYQPLRGKRSVLVHWNDPIKL